MRLVQVNRAAALTDTKGFPAPEGNHLIDMINALILRLGGGANVVDAPLWDVGDIKSTARTTAQTGWLFCYGQAISRTTYAVLFEAIATDYGVGDGSTTFNVPDLRGRVVAGQDDMGGVSANRLTAAGSGLDGDVLGGSGGAETHTLTEAQLASHTHQQRTYVADTGTGVSVPLRVDVAPGDTNAGGANGFTAAAGSGAAHNNVQPTIILNYVIYAGA